MHQPDVRYASACRDLPQIQLFSGMSAAGFDGCGKHQFLKTVESVARHDKLKHIGHLVGVFL
ncbi:MAG TPA: hypothetical protein VIG25_18570 [Pyrinomonadaceae bacterium]|jgi:hypothetical protein